MAAPFSHVPVTCAGAHAKQARLTKPTKLDRIAELILNSSRIFIPLIQLCAGAY